LDWDLALLIISINHGGDLEHFSGTLAVTCSNDWGMDIDESEFLKELMSGHSQGISCSGHGWNQIGSWSKVQMVPE
jgi:hypothetical protein